MGVSKGNLCKALAVVAKVEPAVIAQRIAGNWNWDELTMEEILHPDEDEEEINRPFPFCLASPLQKEPKTIGKIEDWQVEWKWDGIRAQLLTVKGGGGMLWSRGEESIGESFRSFGFYPVSAFGHLFGRGNFVLGEGRLTLLLPIAVPYREKKPES